MTRVVLQYGRTGLPIDLPAKNVTVVEPRFVPGLADEPAAFREAVRRPIGRPALREIVRATDRVAIVIPDHTRPLPRERLMPWLFAELDHVPANNFVIINGTGSHRANTPDELRQMVGDAVFQQYRIVNHDSRAPAMLAAAGRTVDGRAVAMNRDYVEADRRIVLGFIEPHFMAGFSGGYKGVFPAVADLESIKHYHRAAVIGDPKSTWGVLAGNPTQAQIRANGALLPVDFLINVTQNRAREITGFFCGDVLAAHEAGCAFAKRTAMIACPKPFPIVVTSNSGFPLDQNLYQTVKGMSAAAQIVTDGGLIIAAAECGDGFPEHGSFKKFLFEHRSAQAMLDTIDAAPAPIEDQWQVQLLALILVRARVGVYSKIHATDIRRAHLEPVADIAARVRDEFTRIGADAPIAVLPEGPMTIPYLAEGVRD
ncbi:MAG: nickel-dependent lactate racemase [Opitutaceae bacterium]|nr:nickel-dependent lactate racemase [Opitutaceae bacterium]